MELVLLRMQERNQELCSDTAALREQVSVLQEALAEHEHVFYGLRFALRLRAAARAAQEIGAEFFTTTLTTGPRKSAQTLYEVGKVIGEEASVAYLPSDFKKRGGYEHSLAVCAAYGFYRQNYCGCRFSAAEAAIERHERRDERKREKAARRAAAGVVAEG